MSWINWGPTLDAMNWSPRLLGWTPSAELSMLLVNPAAREQSAITMGDALVVFCCTQPGMALLSASIVWSLQLVGISLSTCAYIHVSL